jgi:dTDP-glucose pyrophosphorylase
MTEELSKYAIHRSATIREALLQLDRLSDNVLTLFVIDGGQMEGTLTDGDIRRALIRNVALDASVEQVMNRSFKFIGPEEKNIRKIREIRDCGVQLLPCLGQNRELLRIYNLKEKKSILPVDAVLMAGGKGERLRPLTANTPKPLLKIGGKPIIDYNVERLMKYGVEDIHVTVNYLAEQMEAHFKEKRQGIAVHCVREKEYMGTIASIKGIPEIRHEDILVMNSDLLTNIDFEDFYLHFLENDAEMSAASVPYAINVPYGIFELEGSGIRGIKEKPAYNYYANAGIYLIKKTLLDLIPGGAFFNATDLMDLLIAQQRKVIHYPLIGYWIDIGKPADYQKAQDFAEHIREKP